MWITASRLDYSVLRVNYMDDLNYFELSGRQVNWLDYLNYSEYLDKKYIAVYFFVLQVDYSV